MKTFPIHLGHLPALWRYSSGILVTLVVKDRDIGKAALWKNKKKGSQLWKWEEEEESFKENENDWSEFQKSALSLHPKWQSGN